MVFFRARDGVRARMGVGGLRGRGWHGGEEDTSSNNLVVPFASTLQCSWQNVVSSGVAGFDRLADFRIGGGGRGGAEVWEGCISESLVRWSLCLLCPCEKWRTCGLAVGCFAATTFFFFFGVCADKRLFWLLLFF